MSKLNLAFELELGTEYVPKLLILVNQKACFPQFLITGLNILCLFLHFLPERSNTLRHVEEKNLNFCKLSYFLVSVCQICYHNLIPDELKFYGTFSFQAEFVHINSPALLYFKSLNEINLLIVLPFLYCCRMFSLIKIYDIETLLVTPLLVKLAHLKANLFIAEAGLFKHDYPWIKTKQKTIA